MSNRRTAHPDIAVKPGVPPELSQSGRVLSPKERATLVQAGVSAVLQARVEGCTCQPGQQVHFGDGPIVPGDGLLVELTHAAWCPHVDAGPEAKP